LKSVAPVNPSLREVVGCLQQGLSNVESENDGVIESDQNTECLAAEQQDQEVYQFQIFTVMYCNKTLRSVHAGVATSLSRALQCCMEVFGAERSGQVWKPSDSK
jgi:hypothetical protein